MKYTAQVNSFTPARSIPFLAWAATAAEFTLGLTLLLPLRGRAARIVALASAALLAVWCLPRGLKLRFTRREHGWLALQGALMFGINHVCVYLAGYAMIVILVVALALSTVFEGLQWRWGMALGAVLCLAGNALVLPKRPQAKGSPA